MDFNEYQSLAARTARRKTDETDHHRLTNFALGLTGEAGEVADAVKKAVFHGHLLTEDMLCKELGDVLWYVAALAGVMGLSLSEIAETNIAKLRARYPQGFSEEASRNRSDAGGGAA